MNQLAINTVGDELEASAAFCRSEGIGIEITDFAFPWNLDNDLTARISRHTEAVAEITPVISHGPFFDLVASSPDPAIVSVAGQRHHAALAATGKIGASLYVAHTNFTPLIRDSSYRKNWPRRMLDFWLPLADEAGKDNIVICFENVWEPVPDIQAELIDKGNHPHIRASFDNGHALVSSSVPASQWVAALGPMLTHCHLHDNSGESDEHKPIGEGKEDWRKLMTALEKCSPQAILVAESDRLKDNKLSIDRLKGF
jgi:sugar phosphate isomerase/epimerase